MTFNDHVKMCCEYKHRLVWKPVFSPEQEAKIHYKLIKLNKMHYGVTPQALRRINSHLTQRRKKTESLLQSNWKSYFSKT